MSSPRGDGMDDDGPQQATVYCVLPADLAPKLHDLLRRHFRDEPQVEVVIERRGTERRGSERRAAARASERAERRRVRSASGRRIGERRAATAPVPALPLPRRARAHAVRIQFVERLEPATSEAEDRDTAALILRFQAGDQTAFDGLYMRYFDRVYTYLRIAFNDQQDAEDAAQETFVRIFDALPRYEQRGRPFQAWLFTIVRNVALTHLRKQGRIEVVDAETLNRHRLENGEDETAAADLGFGWITDHDLLLFVERLPLAQRQVLVLRYMMDLDSAEVGRILGRSPDDVRMLQHRALRYLKQRLGAVHGRSGARPRARSRARLRQSLVLRGRRFSLVSWK